MEETPPSAGCPGAIPLPPGETKEVGLDAVVVMSLTEIPPLPGESQSDPGAGVRGPSRQRGSTAPCCREEFGRHIVSRVRRLVAHMLERCCCSTVKSSQPGPTTAVLCGSRGEPIFCPEMAHRTSPLTRRTLSVTSDRSVGGLAASGLVVFSGAASSFSSHVLHRGSIEHHPVRHRRDRVPPVDQRAS